MEKSISRKGFLTSATFLGIGSIFSAVPALEQYTFIDANPDLLLDSDEGGSIFNWATPRPSNHKGRQTE